MSAQPNLGDDCRVFQVPANPALTRAAPPAGSASGPASGPASGSALSAKQKRALDHVVAGRNAFITGPAGSGKSMLINRIFQWARATGKKIQITALTGCASLLLGNRATTIHSWSGIRLGKEHPDVIVTRIHHNRRLREHWTKTQILIVDEVSMMSKKVFELLDHIGRRIRCRDHLPFGGLQVVFTGDFFQLAPIRDPHDESGDSGRFCFESDRWLKTFPLDAHIQLDQVFRQADPVFQQILASIRRGECSDAQAEVLQKRTLAKFDPEKHNGCVPVKLFPTRAQVNGYNDVQLCQLPGKEHTFNCVRKTNCPCWMVDMQPFSMEESNDIRFASAEEKSREIEFLFGNAPVVPSLVLKVGAAVMCTANLDLEIGICNGSLGRVVRFVVLDEDADAVKKSCLADLVPGIEPTQPTASATQAPVEYMDTAAPHIVVTEKDATEKDATEKDAVKNKITLPIVRFHNGVEMVIAPHWWQSPKLPCSAVSQLPLMLAWSMSIHKSQGANLPHVDMDVGKQVFADGQAYVALSRVTSLDGLYLSAFMRSRICANSLVREFYDQLDQLDADTKRTTSPSTSPTTTNPATTNPTPSAEKKSDALAPALPAAPVRPPTTTASATSSATSSKPGNAFRKFECAF